jgi:hypothetical protein
MKWFRANIRQGAKLALFALVVQFVLSLGHMHIDRAHAIAAGPPVAAMQMQADHDSDHHEHRATDPCCICAVMAMAATALFSKPPALQLLQAVEFVYRLTRAEFDHLTAISGAQQPRGPPAS